MNSIRTKTTLLTVCAIVISMTIATLLSVTAIRNLGNSNSEEMLLLLCETGEKNLDSYFDSVEQYLCPGGSGKTGQPGACRSGGPHAADGGDI